jgi:hypothetical protein
MARATDADADADADTDTDADTDADADTDPAEGGDQDIVDAARRSCAMRRFAACPGAKEPRQRP